MLLPSRACGRVGRQNEPFSSDLYIDSIKSWYRLAVALPQLDRPFMVHMMSLFDGRERRLLLSGTEAREALSGSMR